MTTSTGDTMSAVLCLRGAGRKYPVSKGDFWALKDVSFSLGRGEIVGVIGRNSSGKSTLLNILSGSLPLSEGEREAGGKVSALLTLGAGFQDEFTGRENVYLNARLIGFTRQEIEDKFKSILEFSELGAFIDSPLGSYSSGMKVRLGFSVAIHKDFDVLLTDEILAVGDVHFQKKCLETIASFRRQGKAVVLATQDTDLAERLCDRLVLLEDGRVEFAGDPREAVERYQGLLNKSRVLMRDKRIRTVTETKRWAQDMADWGSREGTGEARIEKVETVNRWGMRTSSVDPGDQLKVRVRFSALEEIGPAHFGVALFRDDGVYCYGPNTDFDGITIPRIPKGKGSFEITFHRLTLAPGEYRISVAIWDSKEVFAHDYHRCMYGVRVNGKADGSGPLAAVIKSRWTALKQPAGAGEPIIPSLRLLDGEGREKGTFLTGSPLTVRTAAVGGIGPLRVDIFRSDGILCASEVLGLPGTGGVFDLFFPEFPFLPGGYRVTAGQMRAEFTVVSSSKDHGTVFIPHTWRTGIKI